MTAQAKDGPYIYQPFGMQHKEHWAAGKIYGIGGLGTLTRVEGLTKTQAQIVLDVLARVYAESGEAAQ